MALSSPSRILCFVLALSAASLSLSFAAFHDYSIVGYSPEDLESHDKLIELFENWLSNFEKAYETVEEKLLRFEVFKDNLKHIDETNKKVKSYWLGLNEFADLSHEEFKKMYLGLKTDIVRRDEERAYEEFAYKNVEAVPRSVDWRKKGAVAEVKNQGSCGNLESWSLMCENFDS